MSVGSRDFSLMNCARVALALLLLLVQTPALSSNNLGFWRPAFVLDSVSVTPVVAFGLRRLTKKYTGPLIQVRRSSDSTLQNINSNGRGLDSATLLSFCAATNCYIATWYDQSGLSNHATQATAANQPLIVSAGVINLQNSRPAIAFSGSPQSLQSAYVQTSVVQMTINAVFQTSNAANGSIIWNSRGSGAGHSVSLSVGSKPSQSFWGSTYPAVYSDSNGIIQGVGSTTSYTGANSAIFTGSWAAASGVTTAPTQFTLYANGNLQTTTSNSVGSETSPLSGLGGSVIGYSQAWGDYCYGNLSELIVFASTLGTSDRQALEHNQEGFFGITGS